MLCIEEHHVRFGTVQVLLRYYVFYLLTCGSTSNLASNIIAQQNLRISTYIHADAYICCVKGADLSFKV